MLNFHIPEINSKFKLCLLRVLCWTCVSFHLKPLMDGFLCSHSSSAGFRRGLKYARNISAALIADPVWQEQLGDVHFQERSVVPLPPRPRRREEHTLTGIWQKDITDGCLEKKQRTLRKLQRFDTSRFQNQNPFSFRPGFGSLIRLLHFLFLPLRTKNKPADHNNDAFEVPLVHPGNPQPNTTP